MRYVADAERYRALNEIAARRGQTLARLALAWTLRDGRVTSALIGASSVAQLEQNVALWSGWTSIPTSWLRSTGTLGKGASISGRRRAGLR